MSDAQRLFIGVKVSLAGVEELRATAAAMKRRCADDDLPPVRWVDPSRYHITIKFLDWCAPESFYAIRDTLGPALEDIAELRFRPQGVGGFPSLEKARVLWVGVDEPAPLVSLASRVDEVLEPLGFTCEPRELHPHITLGRTKGRGKTGDFSALGVGSEAEQTYSLTTCRSVVLFESELKSSGSEYKVRWEWPLRSGSVRGKR